MSGVIDQSSPILSAAPATSSPSWHVRRLRRLAELHELAPQWQALAARAAEPNVFYEPWMMLPALELFHRTMPLEVYAVYREEAGAQTLVGLLPFQRGRRYGLLPARYRRPLRYYFCALCTPLLDREHGARAAQEAVTAMRGDGGITELALIGGDGPVAEWLRRALHAGNVLEETRIDRACYQPTGDYLSSTFRPDKRRDLRRLERRLTELGELRYVSLQPTSDLEPWLDAFLTLEASGWKGRDRTALNGSAQSAAYFRRICRTAHALGRLELHALRLDDRNLAMICLLAAGGGLFALRTAYDERYARYSLGTLLSVWHTAGLQQRQPAPWIDSCSAPDNPLANLLWKDRRTLLGWRLASGAWASVLRGRSTVGSLLRSGGRAA